jgi:hypothetical protein
MIDGEIAITGSVHCLHERYCTSYFVEISSLAAAGHTGDNAESLVLGAFDSIAEHRPVCMNESLPCHFKLQVPYSFVTGPKHDDTKQFLAQIFELLESEKEELAGYSI